MNSFCVLSVLKDGDYDNPDAFELWAEASYRSQLYEVTATKCAEGLRYAKVRRLIRCLNLKFINTAYK